MRAFLNQFADAIRRLGTSVHTSKSVLANR